MSREPESELLDALIGRYPTLAVCEDGIRRALELAAETFACGGTLFRCGNGGSWADAAHISGELIKSFRIKRPLSPDLAATLRESGQVGERLAEKLERGLPAIALSGGGSDGTAFANDVDPALVYAQQLCALGRKGDALLAISTSGNAENCVAAAVYARSAGIRVMSLTGDKCGGGALATLSDVAVTVPETETYIVQELHLPVYHCLCAMLEQRFFGENGEYGSTSYFL